MGLRYILFDVTSNTLLLSFLAHPDPRPPDSDPFTSYPMHKPSHERQHCVQLSNNISLQARSTGTMSRPITTCHQLQNRFYPHPFPSQLLLHWHRGPSLTHGQSTRSNDHEHSWGLKIRYYLQVWGQNEQITMGMTTTMNRVTTTMTGNMGRV